jgi:hypothetical protein
VTKKAKSGTEQNPVIATTRAIDDVDNKDDVMSIDEEKF